MRVLVVDDDDDILSTIIDNLEQQGMQTDCASNGQQACNLHIKNEYDVIVLDVMMPGIDGLSTCQKLRQKGCTAPILFLTARDTIEDKINGFEAGADDYLVKPFYMSELICRIRALSQRLSKHSLTQIKHGDIVMDLEQKWVERAGIRLTLSSIQFKIIKILMLQYPKIVSKDQLKDELWGDEPPESDSLRSLIYQLRQIIDKPFSSNVLETIRGQGIGLKAPS
ncbi:MAG: response regulator transcription factor [Parashewanella sp.]